jgi:D-glycero-D-manno-heptose 1,7-bisphosphate phosphatase
LDRDGVLNRDFGYCYRAEDLELIPGIVQLLSAAARNYLLIVVTNQSGIARGMFTAAQMHQFNGALQDMILKSGGPILTDFFWCPHLPEGKVPVYSVECKCRKPQPGMILAAATQYDVDLDASFMIGDKPSDMEAASRAGVKGIQIGSRETGASAYASVDSLAMVAAIIGL